MAAVSSNAGPRKNKTVTDWCQGLPWPERRSANVLLPFTLSLTLPRSVGFLKVEISLHCTSEKVLVSCSDHVREFPKQASLASQTEWPYRPFPR